MQVGREHVVLVEGHSRRSTADRPQLVGRTDSNKKCVLDANVHVACGTAGVPVPMAKGDYIRVRVESAGPSTLIAVPIARVSGIV